MSKISIIVPVYNAEDSLDRCICSVLDQTCPSFELILVDDGSTDGSPEICDRYAAEDSRVVVIHKVNGGVSSARNAGIEVAAGEYLMFLDADDVLAKSPRDSMPAGRFISVSEPLKLVQTKACEPIKRRLLFSPKSTFLRNTLSAKANPPIVIRDSGR